MVRNFTFALMGILVGLAIFTYGFATKKTVKPVVATKVTNPRVDEIQRNVIIDPVDIRNPDTAAAEVNASNKTAPVTAQVQTPPTQFTQSELAAQTAAPAGQAPAATSGSLAQDIIPVPATPEPVIDEGWANAGFLPPEATQSSETDNSLLEEEIVK